MPGFGLTPRRGEVCLAPNGARFLATRLSGSAGLAALSRPAFAQGYGPAGTHRLFALPTMAKQNVLPFGKLHMRRFFTRERDDSFSPASRGTEMSV